MVILLLSPHAGKLCNHNSRDQHGTTRWLQLEVQQIDKVLLEMEEMFKVTIRFSITPTNITLSVIKMKNTLERSLLTLEESPILWLNWRTLWWPRPSRHRARNADTLESQVSASQQKTIEDLRHEETRCTEFLCLEKNILSMRGWANCSSCKPSIDGVNQIWTKATTTTELPQSHLKTTSRVDYAVVRIQQTTVTSTKKRGIQRINATNEVNQPISDTTRPHRTDRKSVV